MTIPSILRAAFVLSLGSLASACVHHVTYRHEERQKVRFTGVKAAQTFYEAYASADSPKGNGAVSLFIPLPYQHRTVFTPNALLNGAIKACDADRDGVISNREAAAFAAKGGDR